MLFLNIEVVVLNLYLLLLPLSPPPVFPLSPPVTGGLFGLVGFLSLVQLESNNDKAITATNKDLIIFLCVSFCTLLLNKIFL